MSAGAGMNGHHLAPYPRRGAFIVLEGLDRSGKSTQSRQLVANLTKAGIKAKGLCFPDRTTTTTGPMIDQYLKQSTELDDRAIHLLFSVNRWEKAKGILRELEEGTTLVCDRYAFSGIAFSAAKGLDYGWCKSPDVGLPAPDLTLFLSVSPEVAAQRGGFGAERYESSAMQSKVRELFKTIGHDVGPSKWRTVDAGQSIEAIEQEVYALASEACQTCPSSPIGELWK